MNKKVSWKTSKPKGPVIDVMGNVPSGLIMLPTETYIRRVVTKDK